jgi:hypothetical protein
MQAHVRILKGFGTTVLKKHVFWNGVLCVYTAYMVHPIYDEGVGALVRTNSNEIA